MGDPRSSEQYLQRKVDQGSLDQYVDLTYSGLEAIHKAKNISQINFRPGVSRDLISALSEAYSGVGDSFLDNLKDKYPLTEEQAKRTEEGRGIVARRERLKGKPSVEYNYLPRGGKTARYSEEEKSFLINAYGKGFRGEKLKDKYNDNFPGRSRSGKPQSFNRRAQEFKKKRKK